MSSDSRMASQLSEAGGGRDIVIAKGITKHYTLYRRPSERLTHLFMPWRTYPHFEALKGISFRVARGETVGIIGQNGAGKSTLLQIVTGTVPPSTGTIEVAGRVAALLELGAGFEPDFTGRENIVLNGTILGLTGRELKDRMGAIIEFSGLEEFIDRPVRTYSSGMYMRLAFSVAAHVDAELLIIDEALAVGDGRFTQKCMRYLSDFKRRGSILFVSHDLGAVTALCDRVIWLDHGAVRAEGSAVDISEQYVASLFEQPVARDLPAAPPVQAGSAAAVYEQAAESAILFDVHATGAAPGGLTSSSPFNPQARSFGIGGATIVDAGLFDPKTGARLDQVAERQEVDLRIVSSADSVVGRPIFGFYIKDRLGQLLLGDNTYGDKLPQMSIAAGECMSARFRFRWPALATGTYALTVALADGTISDHVQRHWMHDAVLFDVLSSSNRFSLVGLEFTLVTLDRVPSPPAPAVTG